MKIPIEVARLSNLDVSLWAVTVIRWGQFG